MVRPSAPAVVREVGATANWRAVARRGADMKAQNVYDPLIGKVQQFQLATQVVKMILKIDDVIIAGGTFAAARRCAFALTSTLASLQITSERETKCYICVCLIGKRTINKTPSKTVPSTRQRDVSELFPQENICTLYLTRSAAFLAAAVATAAAHHQDHALEALAHTVAVVVAQRAALLRHLHLRVARLR